MPIAELLLVGNVFLIFIKDEDKRWTNSFSAHVLKTSQNFAIKTFNHVLNLPSVILYK